MVALSSSRTPHACCPAHAAVCGFSSWSPVVVLCYDRSLPPIQLPLLGVGKEAAEMLKLRRKKVGW